MDKKLQNKLYKKYPKIFHQKDEDIRNSSMPWGICCDSGWYDLLDNLCSCIQWRIDNPPSRATKNPLRDSVNYILRKINNFLYKISYIIAGEKTSGYKVYEEGEYEKLPKLARLLRKLASKIPYWRVKFVKVPIRQVEATQVKEKFAKFHFYYSGGDDLIDGMIQMAEKMSGSICEICGNPAETRSRGGWYKTVCKDCIKANKELRGYK